MIAGLIAATVGSAVVSGALSAAGPAIQRATEDAADTKLANSMGMSLGDYRLMSHGWTPPRATYHMGGSAFDNFSLIGKEYESSQADVKSRKAFSRAPSNLELGNRSMPELRSNNTSEEYPGLGWEPSGKVLGMYSRMRSSEIVAAPRYPLLRTTPIIE